MFLITGEPEKVAGRMDARKRMEKVGAPKKAILAVLRHMGRFDRWDDPRGQVAFDDLREDLRHSIRIRGLGRDSEKYLKDALDVEVQETLEIVTPFVSDGQRHDIHHVSVIQ